MINFAGRVASIGVWDKLEEAKWYFMFFFAFEYAGVSL